MRVTFRDRSLATDCSSEVSADSRWGTAADTVRLAIELLAVSSTVDEFEALPNVKKEEDMTVFQGLSHEVQLGITCPTTSEARVTRVVTRSRCDT